MDILGLGPRDKAAMLVVHTIIFFRRIYMKMEFLSQRREMFLFLTTNIAAMTSRANRQYDMYLIIRQVVDKQGYWFFESCSTLNLFCVFLVQITHLERCPYLVIWKNHEKPLSRVSGSVLNKIVKRKIGNNQMNATERTFLWGEGWVYINRELNQRRRRRQWKRR